MDGLPRIALVIGNASYQFARPLRNTHADATAVAEALSAIGFQSHISLDASGQEKLVPYFDQSLSQMNRLLGGFNKAARKASMAVIYFSGHGVEINFKNFLIPVEANLTDVVTVQYETVALPGVVAAVSGASTLRLVILDACRDNPFSQTMKGLDGGKSLSTGLAPPEITEGALIFYAAEEGQKAREGTEGTLSPFARALTEGLREPDRELLLVLGTVTRQVRTLTDHAQKPKLYGELTGDSIILRPVERMEAKEVALEPPSEEKLPTSTLEPVKTVGVGAKSDITTTSELHAPKVPSPSKLWLRTSLVAASAIVVACATWFLAWYSAAPIKYAIFLHTKRPASEVNLLTKALGEVGFSIAGQDGAVDQPPGSSPLSGVDYPAVDDGRKHLAAASKVAEVTNSILGTDIRPRPQSKMSSGQLGVWLPYKGDYNVSIRFAGEFDRNADIVPFARNLRNAGWRVRDPNPSGGNDRTRKAAGQREVRYTVVDDRPFAELLAADVQSAGIVPGTVTATQVSGVAEGNFEIWIGSTSIDSNTWFSRPPDQAYCFQRKESPESPGRFLIRCFQTTSACRQDQQNESGLRTACVASSGLRNSPLWRDAGKGGVGDSWFKSSDSEFLRPFPEF